MMPTCPPLLTVDPTRAPLATWTSLTLLMYVFSWSSLGFPCITLNHISHETRR